MSSIPTELVDLYNRYFGSRPVVPKVMPDQPVNDARIQAANAQAGYPIRSAKGAILAEQYLNTEIWLPVSLSALPDLFKNAKTQSPGEWYLPYVAVSASVAAGMIRTPLNQRKGTVKELYSLDDYSITVKGFFIDKETRTFPEKEIGYLKQLVELGTAFKIDNAITNLLLEDNTLPPDQQYRVVIERIDLPEVTGGRKSMRPFSMQLFSDYVFTLNRS